MHAPEDSQWPVLDDLVTRVIAARRRVAAAQAEESLLLAEAVAVVADRTELLRQRAEQAGQAGRRYSSDADLPLREVSLELGMAMRASDRTVQARISDAYLLTSAFTCTFQALSAGEIDAPHAAAIVRAGVALPDEERARYEELALVVAANESPARTAQAVKAIAAAMRPDLFAERARAAVDERSVRLYDLDDGIARLIVDGPAPLIHAIHDRLTAMGRAVLAIPAGDESLPLAGSAGGVDAQAGATRVATGAADASVDALQDASGASADAALDAPADAALDASGGAAPGPAAQRSPDPDAVQTITTGPFRDRGERVTDCDPRTMDQLRVDLLCDLLLTGAPTSMRTGALSGIKATVQITVPALTLAGDTTGGPALLAGYGPIDTGMARRLASLAPGWDRVFTDPHTGEPLTVNRYRPSAQLKRYLAARDERCRTPGCSRQVHRCDRDHTVAASIGGCTCDDNLALFCRRHHTCKHHTGWRVRQVGHGVLEWIGPTGRRYLDRPPAVVRFIPTDTPAPF